MPARPGTDVECRRVSSIVSLAGDRWSFPVIAVLDEAPARFNELKRTVGGISQQMLARTLRTLERDGVVTRSVYATVPPQVTYTLTPLGRSLGEAIGHLGRWAEDNLAEIESNRRGYDGRNDPEPAALTPGAASAA